MTSVAPRNKKSIAAELGEGEPLRGPADIRFDGNHVSVTLDLPRHEPSDLEWEVTSSALIVRCRKSSLALHVTIALGPAVRPRQYVVCATGSVFDIHMERA